MGLHGGRGLNSSTILARTGLVAAILGVFTLAVSLAPRMAEAQPAGGRGPLVVELFTAQGCASCPQANEMLAALAERERVIALTFPVDYWDYLGWRDTFAKPEFSARQRAYVGRLGLKDIYTPEVVINGRREAPGVDLTEIEAIVDSEAARRSPVRRPWIAFNSDGERVTVGPGSAFRDGADVWLIRYDPLPREVRIRSGDNEGRLVAHDNVVRELVRLGSWNGRTRSYGVPETTMPNLELEAVIVVQGVGGGPILAAHPEAG